MRYLQKGLSGPEIRQIGRCREKLVYMSADNNHSIVRNTQSMHVCAEADGSWKVISSYRRQTVEIDLPTVWRR
jgi:hypothetical protein